MASSFELQSPHSSGFLKRIAYSFDGRGNVSSKAWDLGNSERHPDERFSWYHVELPRSYTKLAFAAQHLIEILCPPLKLQDILSLASNGPFCGQMDGAIIFRVNSAGPPTSKYTHKLAARVTDDSLITISLGRIPRLEFATSAVDSLLSEIPRVEFKPGSDQSRGTGIVIQEHVLEFLLTMNHSEEADNRVPTSISNLVVHIIDTHVDHLQDVLTKLEMDLDENERELDTGGYVVKQQMLVDRLFPKMHLKLQRLLQVISHGEQVFPRFKEKCASKSWSISEDLTAMQVCFGRLQKLKENVGFLANRITALQAGLDTWQSEQINRKLYYLSFLSIIFLPLSIVTSAFGMNVGGVPWTEQREPSLKNGFRNVLLLCAGILLILFACFSAGPLYKRLSRQNNKNRWRSNSLMNWRGSHRNVLHHNGYIPL